MGNQGPANDRRQLCRQANALLDRNLAPGEEVRVVIRGVYDSAIIGLDSRLFVFKRGLATGGPFGSKLHEWGYRRIREVRLTTSLLFGLVAFDDVPSHSSTPSVWTANRESIRESGQALDLGRRNFDEARQRVPILRNLIARAHEEADMNLGLEPSASETNDVSNRVAE